MIIKSNEIIGKKVIIKETGEQVSQVEDLLYDPINQEIVGYLVDPGGWFAKAKIILTGDVDVVGHDAVMIKSSEAVTNASDIPQDEYANITTRENTLTNTKVITDDGNDVGSISDIYFDPKTGKVNKYEVSEGIKSVVTGKKTIEAVDVLSIGKDAAVVKKSALSDSNEEKKPIGNYLTTNIISQENELIAQRGDIITEAILERANSAGVMDQVLKNNSPNPQ